MQVWRPYKVKDISALEKVQKRFTKMIKECKGLKYESRLKLLGLTTYETRCLRGDLLQYFKTIKGFDKSNCINLFELNKRSTRGHTCKIKKRYCRSNLSKYSYRNRSIDIWNKLPIEIIESSTINEFKGGLDRHLRSMRGLV